MFKVMSLFLNVQEVMDLFLIVLFSIFQEPQELATCVKMVIIGKLINVKTIFVRLTLVTHAKQDGLNLQEVVTVHNVTVLMVILPADQIASLGMSLLPIVQALNLLFQIVLYSIFQVQQEHVKLAKMGSDWKIINVKIIIVTQPIAVLVKLVM